MPWVVEEQKKPLPAEVDGVGLERHKSGQRLISHGIETEMEAWSLWPSDATDTVKR